MGVATTYNPGSNPPASSAMSRLTALFLLVLVSFAPPAFSADPPPGTTPDRVEPATPATAPPADDIDPATGLARSSVVRPLTGAPPVPDPRLPPPGSRPHIALILPTVSDTLGRLAEALRQGFAAAAEAGGRDVPPIILTAIGNEGPALAAACRDALARGAIMVVAAMTRDGAANLVRSDCARTLALALNEPQGASSPNVFSMSLSLDHEARQVALMAVADGWRNAIVISSPSPLSRRVQESFEREWTRAAGELRARITFTNPDEAQAVREAIAKLPGADMVFLALDQPQARSLRGYITGALPVYATSMSVNPRAEAIVNVDLQDVRYVEMPWFVQPDHPAVMVYPQPRNLSVDEERLYAYGIDALRLALQVLKGDRRAPLDGVTGRITLEGASNNFARALVPAEVDGGRVIPRRAP